MSNNDASTHANEQDSRQRNEEAIAVKLFFDSYSIFGLCEASNNTFHYKRFILVDEVDSRGHNAWAVPSIGEDETVEEVEPLPPDVGDLSLLVLHLQFLQDSRNGSAPQDCGGIEKVSSKIEEENLCAEGNPVPPRVFNGRRLRLGVVIRIIYRNHQLNFLVTQSTGGYRGRRR